MKQEAIELLKTKIIKSYRKYGDKLCLFVMDAQGGHQYTGNEVADEIQNDTPFGVECIHTLIGLTIDLLSRNKIEYKPKKSNDFIEYEDKGDNYQKPERQYENDIIDIRLYCEHEGCKKYIKGVEGYNGSFTAETKQTCDLREKGWYCEEHGKK